MSTKTISVNPDFFNIGGGRKKKTRKKLSHSLRTNFNSLQKKYDSVFPQFQQFYGYLI